MADTERLTGHRRECMFVGSLIGAERFGVKIHKTIQRRVHLRRGGHGRLDSALQMCAALYNASLEENKVVYKATRRSVNWQEQSNQLTAIRKEEPTFARIEGNSAIKATGRDSLGLTRSRHVGWGAFDYRVGRGVIRRRDRATQAFASRKESGSPRFKSAARYRTIDIENASSSMVRVAGTKAHIRIKGLPAMELRCKTPLPPSESLKAIRITRYPIGVYASLSYEVEQEPLPRVRKRADAAVGIDMGVNKRGALSNGEFIEPVEADREREQRLQRKLSRAQGGGVWAKKHPGKKWSKGFRKKARSLARERHRNRVRNRNKTHRITTSIVRRHGLICIEDLKIRNMTRSASGTIEEPGKRVAQKRGLNRSILEQTWGIARQQLTYKAEWAGREVVEVAPHHTSQTCSACGVVDGSQRKGERYACRKCGYEADADVNAAVNILRAGLDLRSRGSPVRRLRVPQGVLAAGKRAIQPALLPMDSG